MRYKTAQDTVLAHQPASLLDYGAGDGRLLLDLLVEEGLTTSNIVAYEPVESFRLALHADVQARGLDDRVRVVGDREALADESFDFIACMGVLEHMPLPERLAFYDICDTALTPTGRIFIDVPIEIGLTLLIKSATRMLLKGRKREYDTWTLLRLTLGMKNRDPGRFDPVDQRTWIQNHKGFDHRLFRDELAHRFTIVREHRTPLALLPAALGNQEVYFHATHRMH